MGELLVLGEQPRVLGRHCCPVLFMDSSGDMLRTLSLLGMALLFSDEIVPSQGVVLSFSFLPCPSYPEGRE